MSLREDKVALTRKKEIHFSDQVLYEQAIIVACIVGIAVTLLWSSAGRVEEEPFSVLYLVPDSYANYVAEDAVTFRYGVDCYEDERTEYFVRVYVNGRQADRRRVTLSYGERHEREQRISLEADTRYPANVSLSLTADERRYNVHFWVYRTPPGLVVSAPPQSLVTNNESLVVRGATQRGAGVAVNGEPIPTQDGSFRTNVSLTEGENTIVVEATDALGNTSTEELNVTLDLDVAFAVTDPAGDLATPEPTYTIRASAGEPVNVTVGGTGIEPVDGSYSHEVALAEGPNDVTVRAVDVAGNVYERTLTITLDTKASLSITHPANDQTVGGRSVTVNGSAEKNSVVAINGIEVYTDEEGRFSTSVELRDPINTITVGAIDQAGNVVEKILTVKRDSIPPTITDLGPRGVQTSSRIVLTATTDEPASCRYSTTVQSYDAMQSAFTVGENTIEHYSPVEVEGGQTVFYVSCTDRFGNQMPIAESLTVSVGGGVPLTSNPSPEGTVSSRNQRLRISTDEAATCKYATGDTSFDNMDSVFSQTGGTRHTSEVSSLADGTHVFYVRCKSLATGIAMTSSARIQFTVDVSGPIIESYQPQGTVTSQGIQLRVVTNEDAVCRGDVERTGYADMQYPLEGDARIHTRQIVLEEGTTTLYVLCRDDAGNTMGTMLSWGITVDTQPPVTSNPLPQGTVSSATQTMSITTNEPGTCAYSLSDAEYGDMTPFSTTGQTTQHFTVVTAQPGINTYYVRCRDAHANAMSSSAVIQFTVQ